MIVWSTCGFPPYVSSPALSSAFPGKTVMSCSRLVLTTQTCHSVEPSPSLSDAGSHAALGAFSALLTLWKSTKNATMWTPFPLINRSSETTSWFWAARGLSSPALSCSALSRG